MQNVWRFGYIPMSLITWTIVSSCLGQGTTHLEDSLTQELRNRSDVAMIVQKLRLLRSNDSYFGERHPKKKSNQALIIECESDLKRIVELNSLPIPQSPAAEPSVNVEDRVPQGLRNQIDVELIIQKLRFLRINESNFGEKHPGKKATQLQIRENELVLKGMIELETLRSTKSAMAESELLTDSMNFEDSLSQELRDQDDVILIVMELLFLRINATSFRENHPGKKAIHEQIQKYESALLAMDKVSARPAIQKRFAKTSATMMEALEDRKDVQVILHKLNILRLNEENFGEEHPKMESLKKEIRELETALTEIIRSDRRVNSKANPFRSLPGDQSRRAPTGGSR